MLFAEFVIAGSFKSQLIKVVIVFKVNTLLLKYACNSNIIEEF